MFLMWLFPVLLVALVIWAWKEQDRSRWLWVGLGLLALVFLTGIGGMHGGRGMMGGYGMHGGRGMMGGYGMMGGRGMMGGYGMMGGWGAADSGWYLWARMGVGVLVLVGLGLLGYHLVKRLAPSSGDAALSVLKLRLARGEVTIEEFETLKAKLQG